MARRPVLVMAGVVFVRSRAEDTGVGLTVSDLPPTSRRSFATRSFRVSACASSSSAALALSSALAELLWETLSIWAMAALICSIPCACSRAAVAISATSASVELTFSAICVSDSSTLAVH